MLTFLALGTVTAGLLFKIAAVPFHPWAPDVEQGAPAAAAAFISVGSRVAGFALLLRLFLTVFWPVNLDWAAVLTVAAVLSLTLGTFTAITQTNLKRMLAYSSVAQAGYILLGMVASVNRDGTMHDADCRPPRFIFSPHVFSQCWRAGCDYPAAAKRNNRR